jgi:hypothetical protein
MVFHEYWFYLGSGRSLGARGPAQDRKGIRTWAGATPDDWDTRKERPSRVVKYDSYFIYVKQPLLATLKVEDCFDEFLCFFWCELIWLFDGRASLFVLNETIHVPQNVCGTAEEFYVNATQLLDVRDVLSRSSTDSYFVDFNPARRSEVFQPRV